MGDPWEVVPLRDEVHIIPINDLCEHHLDGTGCVCGPTVEQHKQPLIIHASLDGRELLEQQDPPASEGS